MAHVKHAVWINVTWFYAPTCLPTQPPIHRHTYPPTYLPTYLHTYIHCIHTRKDTDMRAKLHVHVYTCIHMYYNTYVYLYTNLSIFICVFMRASCLGPAEASWCGIFAVKPPAWKRASARIINSRSCCMYPLKRPCMYVPVYYHTYINAHISACIFGYMYVCNNSAFVR